MEELDLKELLMFFKSKILMLIIIVVCFGIGGCIYTMFLQTPLYSSYSTIILASNDSTTGSLTQSDITLNKNLVDTYAEVVKSKRVLGQVIGRLDLSMTYSALNDIIKVSAVNDTEIIKISVSNPDGVLAKNISNVTAEIFIKEVVNLYNLENADILDAAEVSNIPYNISVVKQVAICLILGLFLGCAVLFVIFYFDRTIKSVAEVEEKLRLPILGTVQEYRGSGEKK